jgi:hypothetical protein
MPDGFTTSEKGNKKVHNHWMAILGGVERRELGLDRSQEGPQGFKSGQGRQARGSKQDC